MRCFFTNIGIVGLDLRWKYDVKLFLAKTLPSARLASQMPVFWREKAWHYIFISNLSLLVLHAFSMSHIHFLKVVLSTSTSLLFAKIHIV